MVFGNCRKTKSELLNKILQDPEGLTAKNAPQFPLEINSVDGSPESSAASTSTRQVVTSNLVAFRTDKLNKIYQLQAPLQLSSGPTSCSWYAI